MGLKYINHVFNLQANSLWNFQNFHQAIQTHQPNIVKNNPLIDEAQLINHLNQFLEQAVRKIKTLNLKLNQAALLNLIKSTGGQHQGASKVIKYQIDFDTKIKPIFIYMVYQANWTIKAINKSPRSARIEIICCDHNNQWKIKFLLNWKNNYRYLNRLWSAKCGLSSPSWNVWL